MKKSTYDDLDKAMLTWFNQLRAQGTTITGPVCAKQAKYFFEALELEGSFDASSGWLTRFKQRHGIREISIQGEKLSGDLSASDQFCTNFDSFVKSENLLPEQIYNADETGLYWKCLPTRTLAFQNERQAPGHKSSKERLTVLCCSNASGTHKLIPVVIGKAKRPRSFKGTVASSLPIHYFNQKVAWMNRAIFKEWFDFKFVPQVRDHLKSQGLPEKAVLLIDNAPSHPNESLLRSDDGNIFVKYFPANVTALIQPMDQGVISSMKRIYRSNLLQKYIDEGNDLTCFWKSFSVLDAIYEISTAWDTVKPSVLKNSWKKLMPFITNEDDEIHGFTGFSENEIAIKLTKVANQVHGGEEVNEENIREWFNCDSCEPGFEMLSSDEIVTSMGVQPEEREESENEEEVDSVASKKVSHGAALNHLESLLDYLESEEDSLLSDKLILRRLRTDIRKKENAAKKQKTVLNYFKC
ncbi:Jerky protein homolog-like [Cryptotermes secundus]|nr:Jerky protein homolog-like [Cryptotermes secundus]